MGRKSGNITMQLNKRIDDLLRIGEKKVKDDPTNSNRVEGIHSIQTASTYRAVAKQLGEYLKEQGVRNSGDACCEWVLRPCLPRSDPRLAPGVRESASFLLDFRLQVSLG